MPGLAQLVIDLSVNSAKFVSGINEANKSLQSISKDISSFKNAFATIATVGATVGVATAAIYGLGKSVSAFADEAAEAEQIEKRLQFASEGLGYTWSNLKIRVDDYAKSVQEMTRFSDDEARQAIMNMFIYTREYIKAEQGAKLAMDMSIRTGQDLASATQLVGMAMSGNVERLGRYIPELRDLDERLGKTATQAQKAEYAIKVLNDKFSGTAQADINSYSGKVAQFNNAWKELKETLGNYLLPMLTETFGWLKKIVDKLNELAGMAAPKSLKGDWEEGRNKALKDLEEAQSRLKSIQQVKTQGLPSGAMSLSKEQILDAEVNALAEVEEAQARLKHAESMLSKIGTITDAKIAAETKKDTFLPGTDTEAEKRRQYALDKIMEGELERQKTFSEAWDAVYKAQLDQDMEYVENHKLANDRIKEGEEQVVKDITDAWKYYYDYIMKMEEEEVNRREYANERIMEGEREAARVRDEAIESVYKVQNEIDMKKVEEDEKKAAEEAKKWTDAIEGGIDVFGRALMNLDKGWKGFFQTLAEGFARLIQDISMAIIKAQLLEAVGLGKGGGTGGGFNPFSFLGGGNPSSPGMTSPGGTVPEFPVVPMASRASATYVYISAVDTQSFAEAQRRAGATVTIVDEHLQDGGPNGRLLSTLRSSL